MRGRPPVFGPAAYRMSSLLLILRPPQPQPRPRGRSPPQPVGWSSQRPPPPPGFGCGGRAPCPAVPCRALRAPSLLFRPGQGRGGRAVHGGGGGRPSRGPGWLPDCAAPRRYFLRSATSRAVGGERARGEGGRRRRWATAAELWMHRLLWQKTASPPPQLGPRRRDIFLAVALTSPSRGGARRNATGRRVNGAGDGLPQPSSEMQCIACSGKTKTNSTTIPPHLRGVVPGGQAHGLYQRHVRQFVS